MATKQRAGKPGKVRAPGGAPVEIGNDPVLKLLAMRQPVGA
jgi:hypothetical protein